MRNKIDSETDSMVRNFWLKKDYVENISTTMNKENNYKLKVSKKQVWNDFCKEYNDIGKEKINQSAFYARIPTSIIQNNNNCKKKRKLNNNKCVKIMNGEEIIENGDENNNTNDVDNDDEIDRIDNEEDEDEIRLNNNHNKQSQ